MVIQIILYTFLFYYLSKKESQTTLYNLFKKIGIDTSGNNALFIILGTFAFISFFIEYSIEGFNAQSNQPINQPINQQQHSQQSINQNKQQTINQNKQSIKQNKQTIKQTSVDKEEQMINELKKEKSRGIIGVINKLGTMLVLKNDKEEKRIGNRLLDITKFLRDNPSLAEDLNELMNGESNLRREELLAKMIEQYTISRDIKDLNEASMIADIINNLIDI